MARHLLVAAAVAVSISAVAASCATVSAVGVGTDATITFNGQAKSAGGPYELRLVENGVVTRRALARTQEVPAGERTREQEVMPVAITFDYPRDFRAGDATCFAIVDRLGLPVSIRREGRGVTDTFSFSNNLWAERARYEQTLAAAEQRRAQAEQELQRSRQEVQSAQSRLRISTAYATGTCVAPPQRREPPRPARAIDPSRRAERVTQICQAELAQRLGCNAAATLLRQSGYQVSPLLCGQNREEVPADELTPWADLFENSIVQACLSGNPMSCAAARPIVRSRQEHCIRTVTERHARAYNQWNTEVQTIRAEPQRALNQCRADVQVVTNGPQRNQALEQQYQQATAQWQSVRESAPTPGRSLDLIAARCGGAGSGR